MTNEKEYGYNYKEELVIDFSMLEHNWTTHAASYMKWGELHTEAIANRDRKKEEIELKYASLDSIIRSNPEGFGIIKLTEAAVSATIKLNDEHQELVQELITLNEIVNVLACAKSAFDHRKKALEGITQLYCAGYFAKPNIPTEAQEALGGGMRKAQQESLLEDNDRLTKKKPLIKRG